jgi:hypothetical protein
VTTITRPLAAAKSNLYFEPQALHFTAAEEMILGVFVLYLFVLTPLSIFKSPLSAAGEERDGERSKARVSQLYAMQILPLYLTALKINFLF